jgi:hypothetical protein
MRAYSTYANYTTASCAHQRKYTHTQPRLEISVSQCMRARFFAAPMVRIIGRARINHLRAKRLLRPRIPLLIKMCHQRDVILITLLCKGHRTQK